MKVEDYITAGAFAKIHGVSHRRINEFCRRGRILYALRMGGRNWYVPKNSTVQPPQRLPRQAPQA